MQTGDECDCCDGTCGSPSCWLCSIRSANKNKEEVRTMKQKIKCIDNGNCKNLLTMNKTYDVVEEKGGMYSIKDDRGRNHDFEKKRFSIVPVGCDKCDSHRIAEISGKTSDWFNMSVSCFNMSVSHLDINDYDGYVPSNIGIGGSDYVELKYCLECGKIQGTFPISDETIKDNLNIDENDDEDFSNEEEEDDDYDY